MVSRTMHIALIHNWPGARNAELDLIGRMQRVLTAAGHSSVIIDPFGNPLDTAGELHAEAEPFDALTVDFCLNLHYSNPQLLDCFSYMVNWNPVAYLVRDPSHGCPTPPAELTYLAACLASHDVLLSAGSTDTDQLVAALAERPNPALEFPDLQLHTTCQLEPDVAPVSLDGFRVFYIGVNWERIADSSRADKRHGGLMELLDATGRVDFYGVKKVCGVEPWAGFRNYKGELPFDNGLSIIRTANRCGVSLVLSSRQHRDSGLVSTRIFQACAARTVIISDDNPFIVEHFGDAVLSFEHSTDARLTCERIGRLITWIEEHPQQAAEMAERAHRIFAERYSLDHEIGHILSRHPETLVSVQDRTLPSDRAQSVDIVFSIGSFDATELDRFIDNLNRQLDVVPQGVLCCAEMDTAVIIARLEQQARFRYHVLPMEAAQSSVGAAVLRAMTRPDAAETFCIYQPGTHWQRHHLAGLLGVLQRGSTLVSQTQLYIDNQPIRAHGYDRSLASLAIGGEPELLRPDHLAGRRLELFSSAAFLFHRKLLINHYDRARHIALFDIGAYFYLLLLNQMTGGELPGSTARFTLSRVRDDDLFLVYDLGDPVFHDRWQVEVTMLASLFRQCPAGRELAALAVVGDGVGPAMPGVTSPSGGMYAYLIKTLRNRPLLKKLSVAVYNGARLLLRLPPHPPRNPSKKT